MNQEPLLSSDAQIVFDEWKQAANKNGATHFDAKRRALIEKALAAYPLTDVLDAVRGWKHSSFHRGDEGKVWNDLGLLLRDADHIEQFRDLARKPPETRRRSPGSPPPVDPDRGMDNDRDGSTEVTYEWLWGEPEPEVGQA